jgi:putative ABC transport system substrate-binding protein
MLVWLTTVVAVLLFAAPLPVEAQAGRVWRIGFLTTTVVEAENPGLVAFRQRLRELGYVEGQNVALEIRSTKGRPERFPSLADELVRLKVDVIVAGSNASIEPAQKATTTIPIVMVIVGDPVASGFVASLARPGGNITGLTAQAPDLAGKRLQLLKEAISNLSRVAILWEPGSPGARRSLAGFEAPSHGPRAAAQRCRGAKP